MTSLVDGSTYSDAGVSKCARREEVAILARQFKMFEPVGAKTTKSSKTKKTSKKTAEPEIKDYVKKFWEGKI